MLKSIFSLVVMSILALLALAYFTQFLGLLDTFYHFIVHKIEILLPGSGVIRLVRDTLALILIPIVVGLIPAFFYWLFTRREMPLVSEIIWMIWIMLITSIALHK